MDAVKSESLKRAKNSPRTRPERIRRVRERRTPTNVSRRELRTRPCRMPARPSLESETLGVVTRDILSVGLGQKPVSSYRTRCLRGAWCVGKLYMLVVVFNSRLYRMTQLRRLKHSYVILATLVTLSHYHISSALCMVEAGFPSSLQPARGYVQSLRGGLLESDEAHGIIRTITL
jgi:hypothetical protein